MKFRLYHDAETMDDMVQYFKTRAKQLAHEGYHIIDISEFEDGAIASFSYKHELVYKSIYIKNSKRGKGAYLRAVDDNPIVTTKDCGIAAFLRQKDIKHVVAGRLLEEPEYDMITRHYQDRKAERSGQFLMNHIDEGLTILSEIKASNNAHKAFMLHPLLQENKDLEEFYHTQQHINLYNGVIMLALEYRNIANSYLSRDKISEIKDIKLSPLNEVNDMLIADKVQNYKDFCLYHRGKHDRSDELEQYFNNWFIRLGLTVSDVSNLIDLISRTDSIL